MLTSLKNIQNAEIISGDTVFLDVEVLAGGLPANLTGATSMIYKIKGLGFEVEKSLDDDVSYVDNIVTVKLNSEDTESIHGVFRHELEIIDSIGEISTVFQGQMRIRADIIEHEVV